MILLNRLRSIVHWLLRREDIERSLDAEIRSYVEISTAEKIREGMTKDEARRHALAEIGGMDVAKERVRTERHGALLDAVWRDIRMAIRSLSANPRFTIVALLTLVLTIGGITTIFTLVDSVIFRALPHPESDRFVSLDSVDLGDPQPGNAQADFLDWKQRIRTLDFVAGIAGGGSTFDEGASAKLISQWGVTADMFPMLGIEPVLGRTLQADDFIPKNPAVIVISHALWQSHYSGSPDAIGKSVRVSGRPAQIVGVMPADFTIPVFSRPYSHMAVWGVAEYDEPPERGLHGGFKVFGRLADGTGMQSAISEMAAINAQLAREYPETNSKRTVNVTPLLDTIVGAPSRRLLWLFFAAVSCVLLIGIANLTNLQGIRNAQRQREMSIRAAVGAGRTQLVRQLLVESILLSLCGGIAGSGFAWAATRVLMFAIPSTFPRLNEVSIDLRVLLFATAVSTLSGLAFGLIPAIQASRSNLVDAMNAGTRTVTTGLQRGRTQRVLIAFETALALVLLVTGGLMANSLWHELNLDSGLKEENLWTFQVHFPFSAPGRARTYWESALRRLRAMPQVEHAALGEGYILGDNHGTSGVVPEGTESSKPKGFELEVAYVSGDYFPSIGAQMVAGRGILDTDNSNSQPVVVLNESAAKLFWPGETALGKKINAGRDMIVVGVVRDYLNNNLSTRALPQMYRSAYQSRSDPYGTIFVRANGGEPLATAIKNVLTKMEEGTTVTVGSADTARWLLATDQRFRTALLLAFAIAATILSLVGIWGVVSYTVTQRNREVALRLALGATWRETVLLIARQAMLPAAAGLLLGTIASLWLARLVEVYLFNVTPTDPATFVTTAALLGLAAIAASVLPAHRAARMNPMTMLRDD